MRILFARHGESEANVQQIISNRDLPHKLTGVGVAQASALAARLVNENVKTIVASPILRAQETAAIVAERLGVSVTTSSALREFDCGMMEGRGDDAAWVAHQAVTQAWDEAQTYDQRILPDGESFNDMKARFVPFVSELAIQNANRSGAILLISHGALLHQMLPLALSNVDRIFTQQHPLGNCDLVIAHPQNEQLVCTDWAGKAFTAKKG